MEVVTTLTSQPCLHTFWGLMMSLHLPFLFKMFSCYHRFILKGG